MNKLEKEAIKSKIIAVLKDGGYIKGYGNLSRLVDKKHNPIINFPKLFTTELFTDGIIESDLLVFKLKQGYAK